MKRTVGAILIKDNKILLLNRNPNAFRNYWSLAGGHVDEGETLKEAVKREVKEETNLSFKPRFFRNYMEDFKEFNWKAKASFFYGSFNGKVKIDKESSKFGWFSLKQINRMKIAFDNKKVINDFIKWKNKKK